MADDKEKSSGGTFLKTIMSSIVGLMSGAVIMYVSPLVNSAIKPPKPVPNFSCTTEGTTATFNNRSTGGTQGWWDFGDGSALEPFSPNQGCIVHKFPGSGNYSVKLALHNLIGEEVDRTVTVKIDGQPPQPTIENFQVTAVTSGRSRDGQNPAAPATFRVTAQLKSVDMIIWSIDDQPLEVISEIAQGRLEHYVTFAYYGPKKIRLLAVGGKSKVEKAADVWVDVPDDEPQIMVQQTAFAVKAQTMPISVSFPAQFNGQSYPFEIIRTMNGEKVIIDATMDRPDAQLVRNPLLLIAPDKKSFTIKGELLRPSGVGQGVPPSWFGKVELKVANKIGAGLARSEPVAATLQLPGRTVLTMPPAAGMAGGIQWEIRQGMDVVMKDTKIPVAQVVRLKDKQYRVAVTQVGTQLQIDATETAGPTPLINTSLPRPTLKK